MKMDSGEGGVIAMGGDKGTLVDMGMTNGDMMPHEQIWQCESESCGCQWP